MNRNTLVRDRGGDTVTTTDYIAVRPFSAGEMGSEHIGAHRMLADGRHKEGVRVLGRFLDDASGLMPAPSVADNAKWVHLHWHLAVFEIGCGDIESARSRFQRRIAPAVPSGDALTDGPQMLARLLLAGVPHSSLPWELARDTALKRLDDESDPYVELHHLLALVGAGDVDHVDRWLIREESRKVRGLERPLLSRLGRGLRDLGRGDCTTAARALRVSGAALSRLGGSPVQNKLFADLLPTGLEGMASAARLPRVGLLSRSG